MRIQQSNTQDNPLKGDLDYILSQTEGIWEELRGKRLFITGGTGFFGCWLLESFVWANEKLGLNASALVLTRNLEVFRKKAPHLAIHPAVQFHIGDIRSFEFPKGHFPFVIHAAAEASAKLNEESPLEMLETIIQGTQHTLEFAGRYNAKKFLLTSSGAVYGKQPSDMAHIPEDYIGAPDPTDPRSVYGEGKRVAEVLCSLYAKQYGLETKIARCFAFVGPYLPLGIHYAIGNFIRDGLNGGPIKVDGDGTPYRSYLYAADLVIWLWTIFFLGKSCYPYNVGSERDITIGELARTVAGSFVIPQKVNIAKKPVVGVAQERYVPSIQRAQKELGLYSKIELEEAIDKTIKWHMYGKTYLKNI